MRTSFIFICSAMALAAAAPAQAQLLGGLTGGLFRSRP